MVPRQHLAPGDAAGMLSQVRVVRMMLTLHNIHIGTV